MFKNEKLNNFLKHKMIDSYLENNTREFCRFYVAKCVKNAEDCPICLDENGYDITQCCKQRFHFKCMKGLYKCPLCRVPRTWGTQIFAKYNLIYCDDKCQNTTNWTG